VVVAGSVTVQARDGLQTAIQAVLPLSIVVAPELDFFLLLETGSFVLLQSGDRILLEA
jgi:hypothetical protein